MIGKLFYDKGFSRPLLASARAELFRNKAVFPLNVQRLKPRRLANLTKDSLLSNDCFQLFSNFFDLLWEELWSPDDKNTILSSFP